MNPTLLKALLALIPASMLFCASAVFFSKRKSAPCFLQVVGAGCLVIVVITHVCEALGLFPWMQWGLEHSAGHYLDLASFGFGVALFPLGYFWASFRTTAKRR